MNFTAKTLAAACAATVANAAKYVTYLNEFGTAAGLNTPDRVSMFCAQITYESMRLSVVEENLDYSTQRLMAVWPSRFRSLLEAAPYARNPRGLANKVYNGRMGNALGGDDGWLYRGRGLKQLTGKDNYIWMSAAIGVDLVNHPDLVTLPEYAAQTAVCFWEKINGNAFADFGDFTGLTKAVNGGFNGLDHRAEMYKYAQAVLEPLGETVYGA